MHPQRKSLQLWPMPLFSREKIIVTYYVVQTLEHATIYIKPVALNDPHRDRIHGMAHVPVQSMVPITLTKSFAKLRLKCSNTRALYCTT